MNRLKMYISYPMLVFLWVSIKKSSKWDLIHADMRYYLHEYPERSSNVTYRDFVYLMIAFRTFRNVLYYRIRRRSIFIRKIYSPQSEPLISCDSEIGGGLYLCHGFSTIVVAKAIGENCWINQQVTIGATAKFDYPTIGNNVFIFAGALILGDIHIGDNVIIGAGTVVTKSVPNNCTVIGNPARIIRRDGIKVNEPL